jgi:hypothetical protein
MIAIWDILGRLQELCLHPGTLQLSWILQSIFYNSGSATFLYRLLFGASSI